MYPTLRGVLILMLAAPILALGTWAPFLQGVGAAVIVVTLALLAIDFKRAESLARFEIKRIHDSKLSLGADNPIKLTVRGLRSQPTPFWIRDEPPPEFQTATTVTRGLLLPHKTWEGLYHVRPLRRGDYAFADINLRWEGPMGLVVRQGTVRAASPVKVYPNLLDIRRYDLVLRQNRLQELGLRNSRMYGEGNEFERLREYLPDDEFRRIDWKATARRNRPVTVEYQTERSQSITCMVDIGRMMQSPVQDIAKLDYVINAVLLLGYVATGVGDKVGLMTFADEVDTYLSPRMGRMQFYRMLEFLYRVEAQPVEPDYRRAVTYLAGKQRKRALIVIFTDISGGLSIDTLVSHISVLAKNSLPLVVTISDPDVHAAAHQHPEDSLAAYQRAAAVQLLDERHLALDNLRRRGVLTLDVPAHQLSWSVVSRYLDLKGRGRL
jgi:uncharacterized protein (DUF58 family)